MSDPVFVFNSREDPVGVWMRKRMAEGLFDDLEAENSEKECASMALASGQWMNEQCNKRNFVICEKTITGKKQRIKFCCHHHIIILNKKLV